MVKVSPTYSREQSAETQYTYRDTPFRQYRIAEARTRRKSSGHLLALSYRIEIALNGEWAQCGDDVFESFEEALKAVYRRARGNLNKRVKKEVRRV